MEKWRDQAAAAGASVTRVALVFEAGRDGFWLARWLRARSIEAYVVHSTSAAHPVSRRSVFARRCSRDTAGLGRCSAVQQRSLAQAVEHELPGQSRRQPAPVWPSR
jgi:hypothetical protein